MKPSEAAKVLREARDLMNDKGKHWTIGILKRKNRKGETSYCALGGIFEAAGANGGTNKYIPNAARVPALALANAIRAEMKQPKLDPDNSKGTWAFVATTIYQWNDGMSAWGFQEHEKSWKKVRAMFTKAARSPKKYLP